MKLGNFYHLEYWDCCFDFHCYIPNILADESFSLLQVFHVGLWSPNRTSNQTLYLTHIRAQIM